MIWASFRYEARFCLSNDARSPRTEREKEKKKKKKTRRVVFVHLNLAPREKKWKKWFSRERNISRFVPARWRLNNTCCWRCANRSVRRQCRRRPEWLEEEPRGSDSRPPPYECLCVCVRLSVKNSLWGTRERERKFFFRARLFLGFRHFAPFVRRLLFKQQSWIKCLHAGDHFFCLSLSLSLSISRMCLTFFSPSFFFLLLSSGERKRERFEARRWRLWILQNMVWPLECERVTRNKAPEPALIALLSLSLCVFFFSSRERENFFLSRIFFFVSLSRDAYARALDVRQWRRQYVLSMMTWLQKKEVVSNLSEPTEHRQKERHERRRSCGELRAIFFFVSLSFLFFLSPSRKRQKSARRKTRREEEEEEEERLSRLAMMLLKYSLVADLCVCDDRTSGSAEPETSRETRFFFSSISLSSQLPLNTFFRQKGV